MKNESNIMMVCSMMFLYIAVSENVERKKQSDAEEKIASIEESLKALKAKK